MGAVLIVILLNGSKAEIAHTQDEDRCLALVETALAQTVAACSGLEVGQICYGNGGVEASWHDGAASTFEAAGDRAAWADVNTLSSTGADADEGQWGIAVLTIDAQGPPAQPETVQLVLMGEAQVVNLAPVAVETPTCSATNTTFGNVNVRSGPGTNEPILATIASGELLTIKGRNATGEWLRIETAGVSGWVLAELFVADCDVMTVLPEVDAAAPVETTPVASLAFTAATDSACGVAANGLLIRAAAGQFKPLQINGALVDVGGVNFVTMNADGQMVIHSLQGQTRVTANGEVVTLPTGTATTLEIANNLASGVPSAPALMEVSGSPTLVADVLFYDTPLVTAVDTFSGTPAADQEVEPIECEVGDAFQVEMPLSRDPDANTVMTLSYPQGGTARLATLIQGLQRMRATCQVAGTVRVMLTVHYSDAQSETIGYTFLIAEAE